MPVQQGTERGEVDQERDERLPPRFGWQIEGKLLRSSDRPTGVG